MSVISFCLTDLSREFYTATESDDEYCDALSGQQAPATDYTANKVLSWDNQGQTSEKLVMECPPDVDEQNLARLDDEEVTGVSPIKVELRHSREQAQEEEPAMKKSRKLLGDPKLVITSASPGGRSPRLSNSRRVSKVVTTSTTVNDISRMLDRLAVTLRVGDDDRVLLEMHTSHPDIFVFGQAQPASPLVTLPSSTSLASKDSEAATSQATAAANLRQPRFTDDTAEDTVPEERGAQKAKDQLSGKKHGIFSSVVKLSGVVKSFKEACKSTYRGLLPVKPAADGKIELDLDALVHGQHASSDVIAAHAEQDIQLHMVQQVTQSIFNNVLEQHGSHEEEANSGDVAAALNMMSSTEPACTAPLAAADASGPAHTAACTKDIIIDCLLHQTVARFTEGSEPTSLDSFSKAKHEASEPMPKVSTSSSGSAAQTLAKPPVLVLDTQTTTDVPVLEESVSPTLQQSEAAPDMDTNIAAKKAYRTVAHIIKKMVPDFAASASSMSMDAGSSTLAAAGCSFDVEAPKDGSLLDTPDEQPSQQVSEPVAAASDYLLVHPEDGSVVVSAEPLSSLGSKKRKADGQAIPEDEGRWAPEAPGIKSAAANDNHTKEPVQAGSIKLKGTDVAKHAQAAPVKERRWSLCSCFAPSVQE